MNIGLTGGIACGKSTVSNMLVQRGAMLVDADRIAREVVEPGSPVLEQIAERFGQEVLLEDGTLNRKKLGEMVFGNQAALKDLQDMMHPSIRALLRQRMKDYEQQHPDKLVVVDVPLLYESGLQSMFEEVMVVYIPRNVQMDRLVLRDGLSLEQAEKRLQAQMDIEQKKALADILINNEGSLPQTEEQVEQFLRKRGLL
ncbi:dephospho-CoA kinase [Paenibacillus radicis (ex Xue et al. 2023)]|uniref:Dephospho-CoA kinase n=1 Tax=Paenibacillus radicis (ex Xue et al. 2023) TaxID=2972489 RepID=A0ABT1YEV4_9BACL|nr:dephospho-CoA kinase [Paenibacillus radicis (ex Xue et al. 2023)]MCR8630944.1 dephospho-CoA kinase [Paenibacillus radicis (ex Xue et al. 2023)]